MSDKHIEKLIGARVSMLLQAPFFGNLAVRLKLVDATEWLPTAATDGRNFYYNRDFIDKLNKKELIFLFAHEVMHVVWDHMGRRGTRDKDKWNAAADYVINWEIHDQGIGQLPDPKTSGVTACFDSKYANMSADEVYEILAKSTKKFSYEGFDVHIEPGDGQGEEMTEEEREALKDEIRQAVMEAAKASGADKVPASVKRMINDLTQPQMDWREVLNMQIQSILKSDFTWMKQARKTMSSGIYLPGQLNDVKVKVHVAIDTSGSMGDKMLKDLLSEVKGIMDQFQDFELGLWCFDTSVHNYQEFTPDNVDDINSYKLGGGGGTLFECNWEFMKDNEIEPHRFLMFTDGLPGNSFGDPDYCETVFLIHSNPQRSIVPPFGTTIYYEETTN
jgi:predicted metal-dependent peptidase